MKILMIQFFMPYMIAFSRLGIAAKCTGSALFVLLSKNPYNEQNQ
jgi:hypothetical protein